MISKTNRSYYICQQCGYKAPQYLGKCPQCDSWNSFVEQIEELSAVSRQRSARQSGKQVEIIDLSKIQKTDYKRVSTKLEEFDRCLGGGIVNGSLVLVSGDPGIGKSTLLTQLALNLPNVLYIAGEESARQIKIRVDRIKPNAGLAVLNEIDVDNIIEAISLTRPSLVIVDSIQTLETEDLESIAGSVGQVRECTHRFQRLAKDIHVPIFLVGHVTKEGNIAGPKTLEHVVDVVLSLEGDPTSMFRILRATKNRFGPTDEVGVFEMVEGGMIEVANPSKVFLNTKQNAPGSAVVAIQSGMRPLLLEIQALVTKSGLPIPRRVGNGIDNNRLQLLVAVLQKRLGLTLFDADIYVNVTGGLRISEPAADLSICTAIVSSLKDIPIREKTVLIGEVGLLGELRTVRQIDKRIKEAQKLGYSNVISSQNARNLLEAMKLALVDNL
ncbi:MAG: DNA repair protein RadA [Candidatus Daviesbacteria bacterium]|nr:DNA repair protein RadA [Candidatus Daviesbacteria bacterium]